MKTGTKEELKLVLGWLLIGVTIPVIIPPALAPANQSSPTVVGLALLVSGSLAATASTYTYRRACTLWQVRLRDILRKPSLQQPSFFQGRFLAGVGTVLAIGCGAVIVSVVTLARAALDQL